MIIYYFAGASRIAMRKHVMLQSNTLTYLLGDHLGSTSLAVDASTGDVVETRYRGASRRDKPWGEVRFTTTDETLPTRNTFTGQYSYVSDDATDLGAAGFGLVFYNARWYDPALGRMAQADTVVPGGVQGLDRYAYVNNSPINYTDPTGHLVGECAKPTILPCGPGNSGGGSAPEPEPEPPLTSQEGGGIQPCVHAECDGESMYQLYLYYAAHPDGEWNSNGGAFTPADFLAWILMIESGGNPVLLQYLMEVAARQLWGNGVDANGNPSHIAYCTSSPCINGIFNFLGAYSGSAKGRYNALIAGKIDVVEQNPANYEDLLAAGYSIQSVGNDVVVNPKWTTYNNDVPVHWGNYIPGVFGPSWVTNMCADTPMGTNDSHGIVYKAKGENGIYIVVFTINQAAYWSSRRSGMCK